MQTYVLSKEAEKDLREIARYTLNKWDDTAFRKYKNGLSKKMNDIGKNSVVEHSFSKTFPQLFVAKYRYHFIFYLTEGGDKPIIIGIIHEQRDIVNRLKNRLE